MADTGKKTDKKKELDELNELFKPVVAAQKVSKGNQHADRRWNDFYFSSLLYLLVVFVCVFLNIDQRKINNCSLFSLFGRCWPKVGAVCVLQAGPVY